MSPLRRSRRLQAGLAGLGVLSALGVAVGLGLSTHTSSQPSNDGSAATTRASDGESTTRTQGSTTVTRPNGDQPQATTQGS